MEPWEDPEVARNSWRWVRLSMAGFAILIIASVVVPALGGPVDDEAAEDRILNLVNEERKAVGVNPLQSSGAMARTADGYSQRMAENGFFAHTPPSGPPKQEAFCGPSENLIQLPKKGRDAEDVAKAAVEGWMNSEKHKENLLDGRWSVTGIGVYVGDEYIYVTQRFC